MPQVSIITPAFNASRFIAETIAAVQHQTIADWEMLIADDCSTDETRDIVARIAENDHRIKLLPLREHAGVAGCRNTALAAAAGRYIAFLDSDDLWLPPKLAAQIAFMEANGAALSYTGFRRISEDGLRVGRLMRVPSRMTYQQLLANTAIATVTAMVDSEKTGALRMREAPRDDLILWLSILKRGFTACGLQQDLARYRVVGGSLSSKRWRAVKGVWSVYRDVEGLDLPRAAWFMANYAGRAYLKRLRF